MAQLPSAHGAASQSTYWLPSGGRNAHTARSTSREGREGRLAHERHRAGREDRHGRQPGYRPGPGRPAGPPRGHGPPHALPPPGLRRRALVQGWRVALRTVADSRLGSLGLDRLLALPQIGNLSLLTSGAAVPNPPEFLVSHRMAGLIATLRKDFDCGLFDSTPNFPVTDPALLASRVDGTVLVSSAGRVSRVALRRSKDLITNVRGQVLDVTLTGIRPDLRGDHGSLTYYAYPTASQRAPDSPPPSRWTPAVWWHAARSLLTRDLSFRKHPRSADASLYPTSGPTSM